MRKGLSAGAARPHCGPLSGGYFFFRFFFFFFFLTTHWLPSWTVPVPQVSPGAGGGSAWASAWPAEGGVTSGLTSRDQPPGMEPPSKPLPSVT